MRKLDLTLRSSTAGLCETFWCAARGPTFVGHHQDKIYPVWVSDRHGHRLAFALELMGWMSKVRCHTSGAPVFLT